MRFTTREDIELPIAEVFAAISDFERFEREVLRRGGEVERLSGPGPGGVGQSWRVRFRHRGRERELVTEIDANQPPRRLGTTGGLGGFVGTLVLDLSELAPRRTRLRVDLDLRPKSLTARLMLQSLKLAKSSLKNRYKARVHGFARGLERRADG